MAYYAQQKTSYNDTNIHIRVVSDVIRIIDPVDTPLIVALGGLDGARGKLQFKENGKKIELLEDEYAATASVLDGAVAATDTQVSVTTGDGNKFQVGHIVSFGTEYAWVSAVAADILTLSRTYGGSNDTGADAEAIYIVGMARLEGDDADFIGLQEVEVPFNYTQIFEKSLNVSGTDEVVDAYGVGSPFAYQAAKAIPELARLVELNLFHGQKKIGTKTTPRGFGGLPSFVGSNTTDAGGTIAKADVDDLMEYIHLDGGQPDLLVANPAVARDLKDLLDTSSFVRIDQEENKLGLGPLMYANSQFGQLRIVMDRWCPTGTAYVVDSRKMGLYTLRPFGWEALAKTGDGRKGEVVGEFSFISANNKAHGTITGITT